MTDKFCVNCRHSKVSERDGKLLCEHPLNYVKHRSMENYLVTGEEQPEIVGIRCHTCIGQRSVRDAETLKLVCGPEGKWFESKE